MIKQKLIAKNKTYLIITIIANNSFILDRGNYYLSNRKSYRYLTKSIYYILFIN